MCVYIAIIAAILQVMMLCVNNAPALKCYSYELESWLAGHLENGNVHWRGRQGMSMYGVVCTGRECTE